MLKRLEDVRFLENKLIKIRVSGIEDDKIDKIEREIDKIIRRQREDV